MNLRLDLNHGSWEQDLISTMEFERSWGVTLMGKWKKFWDFICTHPRRESMERHDSQGGLSSKRRGEKEGKISCKMIQWAAEKSVTATEGSTFPQGMGSFMSTKIETANPHFEERDWVWFFGRPYCCKWLHRKRGSFGHVFQEEKRGTHF